MIKKRHKAVAEVGSPKGKKKKSVTKGKLTDRSKGGWLAPQTNRSNQQSDDLSRRLQLMVFESSQEITNLRNLFAVQTRDKVMREILIKQNSQLKAELRQAQAKSKALAEKLAETRQLKQSQEMANLRQLTEASQYEQRINKEIAGLKRQISDVKQKNQRRGARSGQLLGLSSPQRQLAQIIKYRVQALFLTSSEFECIFKRSKYYRQQEVELLLEQQPFLLTSEESKRIALAKLGCGVGSQIHERCCKWIGPLNHVSQDREEEHIGAITYHISKQRTKLQQLFAKSVRKEGVIRKPDLAVALKKVGLRDEHSEVVVRRLCFFSESLDELSLSAFWQIFLPQDQFQQ